MAERFIKNATGSRVQARHPNRPAPGRELLSLLGVRADVNPAKLVFLKDTIQNDWTLVGGATTVAASNEGVVEMANDVLSLAAQNAAGKATFTAGNGDVPVGTYVLRVRALDANQVAGDLGVKIRNATDANDVLAEVTKTLTSGYVEYEFLFSIRAADVGDTIEITLTKKTATGNTIKVDYAALHPADAKQYPWGKVPDGGRIEYTYTSGAITAHTIYDAQTGGNAVETAAYTYTSGQLTSLAYTRNGVTMTATYEYTGTQLDRVKRSMP